MFRSHQGTLDCSQTYHQVPNYILAYLRNIDTDGTLIGYSDADWASDANDCKSTSDYFFMMSGAAVSRKSQKQTCVALSTAEAEYLALAGATQEATWMRQLLEDLHKGLIVIREDNQSAICIAQNPQYHNRTKHIDIKYHYVREKVLDTTTELRYYPTSDMLADILTEGLMYDKFSRLRALSRVKEQSDFK